MGVLIKDIVSHIDHEDLIKLKNDLDKGGIHLKNLIDKQIKDNEKKHEKYCSTCSSQIDPIKVNNFTLIFGPEDFKKKASFCGVDCLEFFIGKLKRIEEKTKC
jgi:hypothetical protein